jgi:hypothetical protein
MRSYKGGSQQLNKKCCDFADSEGRFSGFGKSAVHPGLFEKCFQEQPHKKQP